MKKVLIFSCLFLIHFSISLASEASLLEDRTIIRRSYFADSETQIEISNKYGTVHLNTWEEDSVKIVITMVVKARSQGWLERLRSNIDFEFISTDHYVVAKSIFRPSAKTFYKEMKDALDTEQAVIIDWDVYIPVKSKIKIENKFGDLYAGTLAGKIDLIIEHGNLKAYNLLGDVHIESVFSEVDVNRINSGRLTISYSKFKLNEAGNLRFESKSSEIEIDNAESLTIDARRDEYFVRKVASMDINGTFCTTKIEDISDKLFANVRYGTMEVDNSSPDFKLYTISSASTDLKLAFVYDKTNYALDITHRKARLVIPKEIKDMKESLVDEREEIYHLTGRMGMKPNPVSKINLNLEGCELFIYHK